MSVTWTLTRERLCDKAMEKCGALGVGETPSSADRDLCLEALDSLLKELAYFGYSWPKYTAQQASITLLAATQDYTLPADYAAGGLLNIIDTSSHEVPVRLITLVEWNDIVDKTTTADYPKVGYIDSDNVLHVWPIQTGAVSAKLWYQRIIDDSAASTAVDLDPAWLRCLVYGIAGEIGDEHDVPENKIQRFKQEWMIGRLRGIQNTAGRPPVAVSVQE